VAQATAAAAGMHQHQHQHQQSALAQQQQQQQSAAPSLKRARPDYGGQFPSPPDLGPLLDLQLIFVLSVLVVCFCACLLVSGGFGLCIDVDEVLLRVRSNKPLK
jgi:hypothetical protein